MFFHGIDYEYAIKQHPILSPRMTVTNKKIEEQLADRRHLIEQFGFEPVHLLESGPNYTVLSCILSCLSFGDTVFAFRNIPLPRWQLSAHEVAVSCLDLRQCRWIVTRNRLTKPLLMQKFEVPVFLVH